MHHYTCPACGVVLKRQEPIPPGKKIKCPKCQHIFVTPSAPAKAVATPTGKPNDSPPKARSEDDDWARNPYRVITDDEEDDTVKLEKQRAAAGIIRDRFEKSKRGPALAKVVIPSNVMLAVGVIQGAIAVIAFVVGLFPLVFMSYYLDTPEFKKLSEAQLGEEWQRIVTVRIIIMAGSLAALAYSSVICVGAFKMRTLESYTWAMIAAILATLSVVFFVGIWNLLTLRDEEVIEGFAEKPPPPI